jgi:Subtilase family
MKIVHRRAALRALAALALGALAAGAFASGAASASSPSRSYRNVAACSQTRQPGWATCFALRRQTVVSGHAIGFGLKSRLASLQINGSAGFGATALRRAYGIRALGSRTNVIAIIDATHSGTAFDDVSEYRKTFGLPPLTNCSLRAVAKQGLPAGKNPCFMQFDQNGAASLGSATQDAGWAQETALDLEMASAACPKCSLLLVEGTTASFEDLAVAVSVASGFEGVRAISNSYGGGDVSPDRFGQYAMAAASGIAVTASSGDSGFGVQAPASFDGVVAVGGTSLTVDASGAWLGESVWSGSGSGCSNLNPAPAWQLFAGSSCPGKLTADVSAVADPATGVSVFFNGGWYVFGGTSASSPIIAGLYALKNDFGASAGDFTAANTNSLHDITSGSNATSAGAKRACRVAVWCNAGVGFDGPSGFGSPFGTAAF